ncbi:MAG: acyl carrier protein [Bacteroidia bacterium]|nr:acyl carrier protein [Bacteroidia bacterium]
MDTIAIFIEKIEGEFEEVPKGTIKPTTDYRSIEGWSSMQALIVIAWVDSEYGVTLNGEDLQKAVTIGDLYEIVKAHKTTKEQSPL